MLSFEQTNHMEQNLKADLIALAISFFAIILLAWVAHISKKTPERKEDY